MAHDSIVSKELSAFADRFILSDLVVKVKNFFGKKLEISEENGFPQGKALFLRIGLFLVCSTQRIVYTDTVEVGQFIRIFQRKGTFLLFILGVKGLVTHEICCNFFLFIVVIFPQIADSQFHSYHPMQAYRRTYGPIGVMDKWS